MQINEKEGIIKEIVKTRDEILASESFSRANSLNKELNSLLKKIEKHNNSSKTNKIVGFKQDLKKARKAVNNYWLTAPKSEIEQKKLQRLRKILYNLWEVNDSLLDDIPTLANWCKDLRHRLSLNITNKSCPIMRTSLPRFRYWKNPDD